MNKSVVPKDPCRADNAPAGIFAVCATAAAGQGRWAGHVECKIG
ncbi:hypothetical protein [Propionispora vibrioides]|nr:hypothetical protein [Propionispora vibrioides]